MRPRINEYSRILSINELYPAIQAEGSRAGRPTIVIRVTGCKLRCWFGEGGFCDSWQSSWNPEKGQFKFNDIIKIYDENPQIKEMMITGGGPTTQPKLLNELMHFANKRGIYVTMETEGSEYVETDYPIDLLSISPKFSNSVPKLGLISPGGTEVTQKIIDRHNQHRLNKEAIMKMIKFHKAYHFKPVWNGDMGIIDEIEKFRIEVGIPKDKTWLMPAGDSREQLIKMYPLVMDMCINMGYNFTGRPHVIAFDKKRYV